MSTRRQIRLAQLGLGPVWTPRLVATSHPAPAVADTMPAAVAAASASTASSLDIAEQCVPAEAMLAPPPFADVDAPRADARAVTAGGASDGMISTMDWESLEASIRGCTRCGLCEGRRHAVPGIGDRKARWLFVGEGPGRNEDLQGEPFVGPAGKLLDNMMRALGLARGHNTYIANIVKCRPVGPDGRDRPPSPDEVAACMPYLERQVALIRPDVIVALGKTAAVSLLGIAEDTSLGSLRGRPRDYAGIPLIITYHPAYLLRKPVDKAKTWRDLCVARSLVDGH